jgi:hypothetical protein
MGKCGGEGQRGCRIFSAERAALGDKPCEAHLVEFDGRCKPCGGEGQRGCPIASPRRDELRGPCKHPLVELSGRCNKPANEPAGAFNCGGENQRGCCFGEGPRRSRAGIGRCDRGLDEELGPQAKCPGIGHTDIECVSPPPANACGTNLPFRDLVAGFKFHVHFAQRKEIATDRDKVIEEAWKQLQENGWGGRIQTSGQEACLKERAVAVAKKAIDKHVDFWIKNPNAPRGGEILKAIGDALCSTVGLGICEIIKIVKSVGKFVERLDAERRLEEKTLPKGHLPTKFVGKTLEFFLNQFKDDLKKMGEKVKNELVGLFEQFKSFLTLESEEKYLSETRKFVEKLFTSVTNVVTETTQFVGLPKLLAQLTGVITGASIIPILTPPVAGFAAVNLGARKLFEWLLPEIVLGTGAIGALAAGPNAQTEEANGLLKVILDSLKKIAGVAAGGIIGALVKDGKKREQIKAILEKVGDVAGKVEKSLGGVLSLARSVAKGNFDEVERALSGAARVAAPEKITPVQFQKMIGALLDFAGDEIWAHLNPKLRDLVGKGLSLFDKLFGLLRGAVVGGVGSIPFVGGVLGFALGFGLDLIVDLVKGFLIDQVIMPLARFVLDKTIAGLKKAFDRRFFANVSALPEPPVPAPLTDAERRVVAAVGRNEGVQALARAMGDSVDGVQQTLKTAARQHQASVSALATTALQNVMLRGVASTHVRELVVGAAKAMAPRFAEPGFTLRDGIGVVLRRIERPLGMLLGRALPNPHVRETLRTGLARLVERAGTWVGAARLGRSPSGVLSQLGVDLVEEVRPALAALFLGKTGGLELRVVVDLELRGLARLVEAHGFGTVLALGEHLHRAVARAARRVVHRAAAAEADPKARLALLEDIDALTGHVASRLLGRRRAKGGLEGIVRETFSRWAADPVARAVGGAR